MGRSGLYRGSERSVCVQVYRDDDTILSWDLINEPRCDRIGCDTDMLAWIEEMAPYVKALDSNHLLTVGALPDAMVCTGTPCNLAEVRRRGVVGPVTGQILDSMPQESMRAQSERARAGMDGFYDRRNCESSTGNPSGWAGYTGQDFMPQHAVRAIDYAAMHLWPDNWKRYDLDFGSGWMRNHTDDARRLGKPLVLEEFGKARRTRCPTASPAWNLSLHSTLLCMQTCHQISTMKRSILDVNLCTHQVCQQSC